MGRRFLLLAAALLALGAIAVVLVGGGGDADSTVDDVASDAAQGGTPSTSAGAESLSDAGSGSTEYEAVDRAAVAVDGSGAAAAQARTGVLPGEGPGFLVLDADGTPVPDLLLTLHRLPIREQTWTGPHSARSDRNHAGVRTGPDGRARFVDWSQRHALYGAPDALWVQAAALTASGAEWSVPALGSEDEHVLQLPTCGSVQVTVVDRDDRPIRGESFLVALVAAAPPEKGKPMLPAVAQHARPGGVLFEHVQTSLPLHAVVLSGLRGLEHVEPIPAPSTSGERVEVRLAITGGSWAEVRVLDAGGEPLTARALDIRVEAVRGSRDHRLTTSPEGRLRIPLPDLGPIPPGPVTELELPNGQVVRLQSQPGEPALTEGEVSIRIEDRAVQGEARADAVLPIPLAEGANQLGDLTLRVPRLLVAGRVLDTSGAPQPEASVVVYRRFEQDGAIELEPLPLDGFAQQTLESRALPRIKTDVDGAFEVLAEPESELGFALEAFGEAGTTLEPLVIEAGSSDVELVLSGVGSLEAKLSHSDLRGRKPLEAKLVPDDPGLRDPGEPFVPKMFGHSKRIARFRWERLEPGSYTLELFTGRSAAPFLTLSDLRVEAGKACDDPRLVPLDVTDRLDLVRLSLSDDDGGLAWGGTFTEDDGPQHVGQPYAEFQLLLAAGESASGEVVVPGYRPLRVDGFVSSTTLTLEPAQRVRVELVGVRADLSLEGAKLRWYDAAGEVVGAPAELDADHRCVAAVDGPGTYQVRLRARNPLEQLGSGPVDLGQVIVPTPSGGGELPLVRIEAPDELR